MIEYGEVGPERCALTFVFVITVDEWNSGQAALPIKVDRRVGKNSARPIDDGKERISVLRIRVKGLDGCFQLARRRGAYAFERIAGLHAPTRRHKTDEGSPIWFFIR